MPHTNENSKTQKEDQNKLVEDQCPFGYDFVREEGTRCFGGDHRKGGTQDEGIKEVREKGHHKGKKEMINCPHGYIFNRENGTRCTGGTHLSPDADEERRRLWAQNNSWNGQVQADLNCDHGYRFTRENGTRCKGGSHKMKTESEKIKEGKDSNAYGSHGSGHCDHRYAFNREDGQRCKGGSHYVNDPSNKWGNKDSKTICFNGNGTKENCPNGYIFNREDGSRCFGGTHRVNDTNGETKGDRSRSHSKKISDHEYDFTREHGARCAGGTDLKKTDGRSSNTLSMSDQSFDFNRISKRTSKPPAADSSDWGQPRIPRSKGFCPHGYGFNHDSSVHESRKMKTSD